MEVTQSETACSSPKIPRLAPEQHIFVQMESYDSEKKTNNKIQNHQTVTRSSVTDVAENKDVEVEVKTEAAEVDIDIQSCCEEVSVKSEEHEDCECDSIAVKEELPETSNSLENRLESGEIGTDYHSVLASELGHDLTSLKDFGRCCSPIKTEELACCESVKSEEGDVTEKIKTEQEDADYCTPANDRGRVESSCLDIEDHGAEETDRPPQAVDPKSCIEDDVYKDLQASFLKKTGGGGPIDLTKLADKGKVPKKLLVQLAYLKDEGTDAGLRFTKQIVDEWVRQIVPDFSFKSMCKTHFHNMALGARKAFLKAYPTSHKEVLKEVVDLDMLSPTLSAFGITKSTIGSPPEEPLECPASITNQFVVDLEKAVHSKGLELKLTYEWIQHVAHFHGEHVRNRVINTIKKYKTFSTRQRKISFLKEKFIPPEPKSKRAGPLSTCSSCGAVKVGGVWSQTVQGSNQPRLSHQEGTTQMSPPIEPSHAAAEEIQKWPPQAEQHVCDSNSNKSVINTSPNISVRPNVCECQIPASDQKYLQEIQVLKGRVSQLRSRYAEVRKECDRMRAFKCREIEYEKKIKSLTCDSDRVIRNARKEFEVTRQKLLKENTDLKSDNKKLKAKIWRLEKAKKGFEKTVEGNAAASHHDAL